MNLPARPPVRGLYLLTPDEPDTRRLLERLTPLVAARPALLQYRNKLADQGLRRVQARALSSLCADHGVPLVINDDWRLAAELGAAGAHLGRSDGDLAEARRALGPSALLGATCHDRLDLAESAIEQGASQVAFGAVFASTTKPGAGNAPLSLFAQARSLPATTVAIGGITPDNAPSVLAAGADFIAVLGAVFDAADPLGRMHAFLALFAPDPP